MIEIRADNLERAIRAMDSALVEKAQVRATNTGIKRARTAWSREIRKDYVVSAAAINEASKLIRTRGVSREAAIILEGHRISLSQFKPKVSPRKGMTVKIRKAEPRKRVKGGFHIPNAGEGDVRAVFKRTGNFRKMRKGRFKNEVREEIKKLFTIAIPTVADNPDILRNTQEVLEEATSTELIRQLNLLMGPSS